MKDNNEVVNNNKQSPHNIPNEYKTTKTYIKNNTTQTTAYRPSRLFIGDLVED